MRKQSIVLLVLVAIVLGACAEDGAEPAEVTFDVEAIEVKGATDGIEAPPVDPTTLSDGYGYKPPGVYDPDNPAKFQVATYMFSPGAMSVVQGDEVTLRFFGVNGDNHDITVFAPDGSAVTETVLLQRGRELTVDFTAGESGHYKIICSIHGPTMTADILSVSG